MSKCKHERVHVFEWAEGDREEDAIRCEQHKCLDCGAWLSLGEANDTPEAMVEVRAAEIAHDWRLHRRKRLSSALSDICDGAEIAGWIESRFDSDRVPEQDGEWSGWLAQTIDSHDATHSEDA